MKHIKKTTKWTETLYHPPNNPIRRTIYKAQPVRSYQKFRSFQPAALFWPYFQFYMLQTVSSCRSLSSHITREPVSKLSSPRPQSHLSRFFLLSDGGIICSATSSFLHAVNSRSFGKSAMWTLFGLRRMVTFGKASGGYYLKARFHSVDDLCKMVSSRSTATQWNRGDFLEIYIYS